MAETCKFYKYQKYVSYDSGSTWQPLNEYQRGELYEYNSPDCGGGVTYYRWKNLDPDVDYYCFGTTKMYKQQKQWSPDNATWYNVLPSEYQIGMPVEYFSEDCGYVHQSGDTTQYLTFVAQENGKFFFTNSGMSYSLDSGTTWSTLEAGYETPTVSSGNKIMWKATISPNTSNGIGIFHSTGKFSVEGNAMSVLYGDNFASQTSLSGKSWAFLRLFENCTGLTNAETLVLPITTAVSGCCSSMFYGCTSLEKAPSLPATTLERGCYSSMFYGCTNLKKVPSLPASTMAYACYDNMFGGCTSLTKAPALSSTTLADYCYFNMFNRCVKLTKAPVLSATTLSQGCYGSMFQGCTSLSDITCLATDVSADDCTSLWLSGVASNGTFTKNASMSSWTTGSNGIPSNWTVQDAQ